MYITLGVAIGSRTPLYFAHDNTSMGYVSLIFEVLFKFYL